MKLLVVTKDNLQVHGSAEDMWARYNRPSVVKSCGFMDQHVAAGTLKVLHQLDDEASDAEFAKLLEAKDADVDAVVKAYAAKHALDKPAKAPPPAKA